MTTKNLRNILTLVAIFIVTIIWWLKKKRGQRVYDLPSLVNSLFNFICLEVMAEYLDAALEEGDAEFFAKTVGDVARAKAMLAMARATGLDRQHL